MLNNSGLMENGDVEALLGPGFRPQLPSQPLQQIDLSFVDQFGQPVSAIIPKKWTDYIDEPYQNIRANRYLRFTNEAL